MSLQDPVNLMYSIAKYLAATLTLSVDAPPRDLFVGRAIDGQLNGVSLANDPFTVLASYQGPSRFIASAGGALNIQLATIGSDDAAANRRAAAVEGALCDADGVPLQAWTIPGYIPASASGDGSGSPTADGTYTLRAVRVVAAAGLIGRDAKNRAKYVTNFRVNFTH